MQALTEIVYAEQRLEDERRRISEKERQEIEQVTEKMAEMTKGAAKAAREQLFENNKAEFLMKHPMLTEDEAAARVEDFTTSVRFSRPFSIRRHVLGRRALCKGASSAGR
eukprot:COSAG04_NODE_2175_length_4628_cov_4.893133_2_plen_110_part_00